MTAFGNGRIWAAIWEDTDAYDGAIYARRALIEVGVGATVRCGSAGALWKLVAWSELSGDRVGATLAPASPHGINPAEHVRELPIPNEAT